MNKHLFDTAAANVVGDAKVGARYLLELIFLLKQTFQDGTGIQQYRPLLSQQFGNYGSDLSLLDV